MCYVRGLASISLGVLTSAHVCAQLRHCAAAAAIISQVNEKKKTVVCSVAAQRQARYLPSCLRVACIKLCGCGLHLFDVFFFCHTTATKSLLITFPLQTRTQIHTHMHMHTHISRICHFTLLSHELVINILNLHLSISYRKIRVRFVDTFCLAYLAFVCFILLLSLLFLLLLLLVTLPLVSFYFLFCVSVTTRH